MVEGTPKLAKLAAIVQQLEPEELRLLTLIAERLELGQRRYGRLDVAKDPRDFGREALAEALDFACYVSMALLKRGADGQAAD